MSRPFPAKYPGECPGCYGRIEVDDEVAYADEELPGGRLMPDKPMHAGCLDVPTPPRPAPAPCTSCHLVHTGECF